MAMPAHIPQFIFEPSEWLIYNGAAVIKPAAPERTDAVFVDYGRSYRMSM
jgi:hypothetical protein